MKNKLRKGVQTKGMQYVVESISDYILSVIGITGEIGYDRFVMDAPYDRIYIRKTVKELSEQKIIRKYYHKTNKGNIKTLRLNYPQGHEALRSISKELLSHFELLEGEKSNAYRGGNAYRGRKLSRAMLLCILEQDGYFTIDYLFGSYTMAFSLGWRKEEQRALEGVSVFDEDGSPKSIREILKRIDDGAPYFFTSNVILREIHLEAAGYAEEGGRGSIRRKPAASSRAFGLIIKDERYLLCYFLESSTSYWNRKVEIATSMYVKMYQQKFQMDVPPQTECVMYAETPEEIAKLLREKTSRRAIDPLSVFDKVYAVPVTENHGDLIRTILEPGLFSRMRVKLLGEGYDPGKNGRLGLIDKRPVYCILDSELGYIKELSEEIEEDALLIAHEWQEGLIEEFFPKSCGMMPVSSEDFKSWMPGQLLTT